MGGGTDDLIGFSSRASPPLRSEVLETRGRVQPAFFVYSHEIGRFAKSEGHLAWPYSTVIWISSSSMENLPLGSWPKPTSEKP